MRRALAPGFVVTVAALVNGGCKDAEPTHWNPPPPPPTATTGEVEPIHTNPPPPPNPLAATRKRLRTTDAGRAWGNSPSAPYSDLQPLNPTDANGRSVFVAYDDTCFTSVLDPNPPKNRPPGVPAYITTKIDCPASMDDPAWDTCPDTLMKSKATGDCVCMSGGGNPPPPPTKNACPKR